MNQLTKQDLQGALNQSTSAILGKVMSHQEVVGILNSVVGRLCTKQEMYGILDASRDKMVERLSVPWQNQQNLLRQIYTQIDEYGRNLKLLENKIDHINLVIRSLQEETDSMFNKVTKSSQDNTVYNKSYA